MDFPKIKRVNTIGIRYTRGEKERLSLCKNNCRCPGSL